MKRCNKFFEQIIHFDELSKSEKEQVEIHAQRCEVCQEHLQEMKAIHGALKQFRTASHIDDERLTRYGIFVADSKSPDYDGKKLLKSEISAIRHHVQQCEKCQTKVEQIQKEFEEIESYLEQAGVPAVTIGKKPFAANSIKSVLNAWTNILDSIQEFLFPTRNRMIPAAVMSFAALFIVVWISPLFRGESESIYNLALVNKSQIQHLTRSASSQLVNEGFAAFNKGEYKTAIALLEKFIQSDSLAISLAYVHEYLGISYLLESKKSVLGRFNSFDTDKVNRGISHLRKVLDLTDNARLREDAFWYLGKAHLMKNDINLAKKSFDSVIKLRGRKVEQAETILADLENINNSGN